MDILQKIEGTMLKHTPQYFSVWCKKSVLYVKRGKTLLRILPRLTYKFVLSVLLVLFYVIQL